MDTLDAIRSRRSVRSYDPSVQISEEDQQILFEHALLSPTSFNIQNWRFIVVKDPEQRAQIREIGWGQPQLTEASLLVVLAADLKAWSKDTERYWVNATKETAEMLVSSIKKFYQDNPELERDEAMRSVGIAAQTLMLAATSLGYDTCPMVGYDPDELAKIINLPDDHVLGMIVVIGKKAQDAFPRGGQLPLDEVVITDSF
ncbi:MAG: nitroreductase family protein [Phycisphaerales bacterium]|nr:nitroreductase family protein [Phycisphaerales bacterium]